MPDKTPDQSDEQTELEKRVDNMLKVEPKSATPAPYKLETPKAPPLVIALDKPEDIAEDQTPNAESPETKTDVQPAPDQDIDDSATQKAVDDILAKESDTLLAVDDAKIAKKSKKASGGAGWKSKMRQLAKNKFTWITLGVLLVLLLGVPVTRYKILGLVIKKSVSLTVIDSKTSSPVSNAEVKLAGDTAKTDAYGRVKLHTSVGDQSLIIKKQYYQDFESKYFVGFKSSGDTQIKLSATGRLVPITVLNKISGKPLSGVEIKILNTTAKTNAKGLATIALPTSKTTNPATLIANGYNTLKATVEVTDKVVKANTLSLTPAGHIYFLSNLSGKIDVVKSNLDGSDRKTVLAGTGSEEKNSTSLLASRDWRFLVLKSKRDTAQAALYLIDTSTDKVTLFDSGDASFDLIGWYGHNFMYDIVRNNVNYWQSSRQIIKAYDADNLQLNLLDQTQAEGNASSYAYQNFYSFYIVNGALVYVSQWYTYTGGGSGYDTTGKSDNVRAVQPNGQNKKDYQSIPTANDSYILANLYEPNAVYYEVHTNDNKTTYYVFENQAVKTTNLEPGAFNQSYPTFLISPSGKSTFWTELRDGKNTLFTGDENAESKKQIATLSDYSPYGWYSDNYVLVSKNSSELYVLPASGLGTTQQPLKVTDYYKPIQNFIGYGYGYGGL